MSFKDKVYKHNYGGAVVDADKFLWDNKRYDYNPQTQEYTDRASAYWTRVAVSDIASTATLTTSYDDNTTTQEKKVKEDTYKNTENDRYCNILMWDGSKAIVKYIENQEIAVLDNGDTLEKVMPYTVDIRFSGSSRVYSYFAVEGELEVGDVVLIGNNSNTLFDGNLARVAAINTKSETATLNLNGFKVPVVPLTVRKEFS